MGPTKSVKFTDEGVKIIPTRLATNYVNW